MNNSKEFLGTEPIGKLLSSLPFHLSSHRSSTCCTTSLTGSTLDISGKRKSRPDRCRRLPADHYGGFRLRGFSSAPAVRRERRSLWGKDDMDSAEKILSGCFTVQIIISAILTAVLLLFGRSMLLTLEPVRTLSAMRLIT